MEKAQAVEVQKGMKERYREHHNSKLSGPGSGGRMGQGLEVSRNHLRVLTGRNWIRLAAFSSFQWDWGQ